MATEPEPVLQLNEVLVTNVCCMGADNQHVKIQVQDVNSKRIELLAFNADKSWFIEPVSELISGLNQISTNGMAIAALRVGCYI